MTKRQAVSRADASQLALAVPPCPCPITGHEGHKLTQKKHGDDLLEMHVEVYCSCDTWLFGVVK